MLRLFWCTTLTFSACALTAFAGPATEFIELSARSAPNGLTRVTIEVEAGGHNLVRAENDAAGKQQEHKLPMSVSAKLQYDQRRLFVQTDGMTDGTPLVARYYERAEAVIKVDESGRTPKLADDRRLIVAESSAERPVLYSPDGPLSREQLDLIDVVGDSISVDRLLPHKPVAKDESWSNDATMMGPLLTLDSVAVCEVKSILESYNASFAKIRLAGIVQGTADGAATELEVRAVYLFDRRSRRITRLNLAVRERRSIGGATPGVDAVAKLQISIQPLEKSAKLRAEEVAKATAANRAPARDLVYESGPLGVRFKHDRRWFVTSEQRESVTLRRVDRGDLIAQCTLSALPAKSAGRQTSLEQFQKDVTYSLGKSFGEMVSSRQWQNSAGLYCYELVARGFVEEVPVEWHYYLLAPESGERVSAAITLEKPMVDRIGQADRELIESIELFPRMPAVQTAKRPTNRKVK
ncbi:MAG: hypothetical protein L0228_17020 [Planctomycetes bacterium]|nr:hypothetical protein [Planctomycetota bacterium]